MSEGTEGSMKTPDPLKEGETIVAVFQLEKEMSWNEAKELVRNSAPSSLRITNVELESSYSGPTGIH